jgi:hypothetical protein
MRVELDMDEELENLREAAEALADDLGVDAASIIRGQAETHRKYLALRQERRRKERK